MCCTGAAIRQGLLLGSESQACRGGRVGCCRLVRTAACVMDVIQACDPSFHATQAGTSGQLGNSLNSNQVSPVPVSGGHAFSAISAGGTHTCAIKLDSTTYCFGSSPANGLSLGSNVPRQIPGGHAFVVLSAGAATTCGLDSAGSVWCFGTRHSSSWVCAIGTAPVQHKPHQPSLVLPMPQERVTSLPLHRSSSLEGIRSWPSGRQTPHPCAPSLPARQAQVSGSDLGMLCLFDASPAIH